MQQRCGGGRRLVRSTSLREASYCYQATSSVPSVSHTRAYVPSSLVRCAEVTLVDNRAICGGGPCAARSSAEAVGGGWCAALHLGRLPTVTKPPQASLQRPTRVPYVPSSLVRCAEVTLVDKNEPYAEAGRAQHTDIPACKGRRTRSVSQYASRDWLGPNGTKPGALHTAVRGTGQLAGATAPQASRKEADGGGSPLRM